MSTQWSGCPCVSTTAESSSTARCSWSTPKLPLPQSTQIAVSPSRTRYPLQAAPCGPPYEPEQPRTVSSNCVDPRPPARARRSRPLPRLDRLDLRSEEPGAERAEGVDRSAGEEHVTRLARRASGAQARLGEHRADGEGRLVRAR